MTQIDHSFASASSSHKEDDSSPAVPPSRRPSLLTRLKALLAFRSPSLRDDLQEALEESPDGEGEDDFTASERVILKNVLKLGGMRVDDVMVPRADIEAVPAGATLGHLIARLREAEHSRLPVYGDTLDTITGFVHIKDVMRHITQPNGEDVDKAATVKLQSTALRQRIGKLNLTRRVLFVPPSMPVGDLLASMQAQRVHMAIVVDEYGGTDGLVTIEDLLEAVVGDIEDEHDEGEISLVRAVSSDVFVADARVELTELSELIPDFDAGPIGEEVDTLGGLVFDLIDRVPARGEIITRLEGFEFEIMAADARRIKKVRITRAQPPVPAPAEPVLLPAPATVPLPDAGGGRPEQHN